MVDAPPAAHVAVRQGREARRELVEDAIESPRRTRARTWGRCAAGRCARGAVVLDGTSGTTVAEESDTMERKMRGIDSPSHLELGPRLEVHPRQRAGGGRGDTCIDGGEQGRGSGWRGCGLVDFGLAWCSMRARAAQRHWC
jgi:hypothetical protein